MMVKIKGRAKIIFGLEKLAQKPLFSRLEAATNNQRPHLKERTGKKKIKGKKTR